MSIRRRFDTDAVRNGRAGACHTPRGTLWGRAGRTQAGPPLAGLGRPCTASSWKLELGHARSRSRRPAAPEAASAVSPRRLPRPGLHLRPPPHLWPEHPSPGGAPDRARRPRPPAAVHRRPPGAGHRGAIRDRRGPRRAPGAAVPTGAVGQGSPAPGCRPLPTAAGHRRVAEHQWEGPADRVPHDPAPPRRAQAPRPPRAAPPLRLSDRRRETSHRAVGRDGLRDRARPRPADRPRHLRRHRPTATAIPHPSHPRRPARARAGGWAHPARPGPRRGPCVMGAARAPDSVRSRARH